MDFGRILPSLQVNSIPKSSLAIAQMSNPCASREVLIKSGRAHCLLVILGQTSIGQLAQEPAKKAREFAVDFSISNKYLSNPMRVKSVSALSILFASLQDEHIESVETLVKKILNIPSEKLFSVSKGGQDHFLLKFSHSLQNGKNLFGFRNLLQSSLASIETTSVF